MTDAMPKSIDTTSMSDQLASLRLEMRSLRNYLIGVMDDTLAGREAGEWVDISVLRGLHEREQALNEALFAEMPYSETISFEPAREEETDEDVTKQLRLFIDAADPKHEGFNLAQAMRKTVG